MKPKKSEWMKKKIRNHFYERNPPKKNVLFRGVELGDDSAHAHIKRNLTKRNLDVDAKKPPACLLVNLFFLEP